MASEFDRDSFNRSSLDVPYTYATFRIVVNLIHHRRYNPFSYAPGRPQNTLMLFTTDNGGMVRYSVDAEELPLTPASVGNNWPLRGSKMTLFEGGVHGVGFLSGGVLNSNLVGKVHGITMHIQLVVNCWQNHDAIHFLAASPITNTMSCMLFLLQCHRCMETLHT